MNEPPILRGDAAALNKTLRELTGYWTSADLELRRWVWEQSIYRLPVKAPPTMTDEFYWMGERIWPPE